ncbi:MAG: hypothetical protein ACOCX5_04385, partial [Chloroflexota bacterium]
MQTDYLKAIRQRSNQWSIRAMGDLSGKQIKNYEVSDLLGQGGFGAVYLAHQPVIDRQVAIKIILPQYANQPQFIRHFETEAQLVARLEHP